LPLLVVFLTHLPPLAVLQLGEQQTEVICHVWGARGATVVASLRDRAFFTTEVLAKAFCRCSRLLVMAAGMNIHRTDGALLSFRCNKPAPRPDLRACMVYASAQRS